MTDADTIMHAISRDHRLDPNCVDCQPLIPLHVRLSAPRETPDPKENAMTGAEQIAAERQRQIDAEGYDAEHDHEHADELALAAACYALPEKRRSLKAEIGGTVSALVRVQLWDALWPWSDSFWKPGDRVRELVKAGALIAAAIDSLQSDD